jgi:hypothetical protein
MITTCLIGNGVGPSGIGRFDSDPVSGGSGEESVGCCCDDAELHAATVNRNAELLIAAEHTEAASRHELEDLKPRLLRADRRFRKI